MHAHRLVRGILVLAAVIALTCCWGCSGSDSPSGPESIVGDLWIGAAYFYFPGGGPSRATNGAMVIVRDGTETGPIVADLTVTINGESLSFQQSVGYYSGVVPSVVSGQNVTVSVSDGLGSVSQTVQVPYALTDLDLAGGAWDISSLFAPNTLTWDNPVAVGQQLFVYIYDYDGQTATYLGSATSDNPYLESIIVFNTQLAYYESMSAARCTAFQVNRAAFSGQPSGSELLVLSGDWGDWPVTSSRLSVRQPRESRLASRAADTGWRLRRLPGALVGQPN